MSKKLGQWEDRYSLWRAWFAWHPVHLGHSRRVAWLRKVERRWYTSKEADIGPCWIRTIRWEYRDCQT